MVYNQTVKERICKSVLFFTFLTKIQCFNGGQVKLQQTPKHIRHNKKNSEIAEPPQPVGPVAPFMFLDKEF